MSRSAQGFACAALAGAVVAGLWLSFATQPELPNYGGRREGWSGDFRSYYLPNAAYAGERIASGELPLWNPHQSLGGPFLATVQVGALYPPNWIHGVLPSQTAFVVLVLLHFAIAAIGAALLASAFGAGRFGGALAGLVYAGSNNLLASVYSPPLLYAAAWAPLLLYFVDRIVAGPSAGRVIGLAFSVSLMLLAGWPYTFAMTALAASIYGGALLLSQAIRRRAIPWRAVASLVLAVAAGFALAAPQLLPTQELLVRSCRALGSVVEGQAIFVDRPHDPTLFWRGFARLGHNDGVPGWAAVVLAAFAVLLPGGRTRIGLLFGIGVLALLASFPNHWPVYGWLRELPLLGDFRFPFRYRFILSLALSIGAGVGVARAMHVVEGRAWVGRAVAASALVLCLATMTIPTLRDARPYARSIPTPEPVDGQLTSLGAEISPGERGRVYWAERANKRGVDFGVDVLYDMEPLTLARTAEMITFFETGRPRTLLSLPHELDARSLGGDSVAAPFYGHIGIPADGSRAEVLDWLSARWIVTAAPPRWLAERYRRVSPLDAEFAVFENPGALPRAYRVPGALKEPPRLRAALKGMLGDAFDMRKHVLLEDPPRALLAAAVAGGDDPEAVVHIEHYAPERVVLRTDGRRAGVVVLTDAFYPGWKAELDGKAVPILRANLAFRGVAVPPGSHEIEMVYRPTSFRWGVALAVLALTALSAAGIRSRLRS